ncbi:AAA family ATPase [Nonomuraea glycinis]|uniref:AAA family ATPase n=1 Tax=Nonomuraea glycinis TaxID=2047744 RepID=UPI002E0E3674|nr:AAA family ATPase [Nonomuraea glycinis]
MKLLSIELENFRPYGGRNRISFAQEPGHNVTLVYGTNGGGKTTLLNAFTWALYGRLSADVEQQDRLINNRIWQEARLGSSVDMSVTVEFEHEGRTYTARRFLTAEKQSSDQRLPKAQLLLLERDDTGATKELKSSQGHIDKMLPERLSKFFFVNGERIEQLVRKEAYAEIQHAIKTLLGLEQLERALKHLPTAANKLRHQLKSEGANSELAERLTAEIDAIFKETEEKKQEKESLNTEVQHLKDEIELLAARLKSLDGAKQLQLERERLERERESTHESLRKLEDERSRVLADSAYLAFLPDLPEKIIAACDALRERGELPAPLKLTFIEDLLIEGECICGTHLTEGSRERAALETWRARAGLAEVEAAWNQLRGAVSGLEERRRGTMDRLAETDRLIGEASDKGRILVEQLNEVSLEIKRLPQEDISAIEMRRSKMIDRLSETSRRLGTIDENIEFLANQKKQKEEQVDKVQVKDENNQRIQRRIAVIRETESALRQILELLSDSIRRRLDTRIRTLFKQASLKNYEPELTSGFQLEYWDRVGDERMPAPKSTGENMLLSLSFVGAVAQECRDAATNPNPFFGGVGGEYPIVMDAVFGNLDDDYRRQIARFLPEMTSQVVVLSSKAQAEGVAENSLHRRVGKQYVITTHTTKSDVQDVTEKIAVNGREYPYQVLGSSFDGAEFTEVAP